MLCLDTGHFHPTEVVSDKLSAALGFVDDILLQLSRGVRWDSDHVVLLDDETQAIANEIVRGGVLDRIAVGLDFFDASINRIAAWVIGTRNVRKAILRALLEPAARRPTPRGVGTARRAWPCSRSRNRCRGPRSGTTTARGRASPSGSVGSMSCETTSARS